MKIFKMVFIMNLLSQFPFASGQEVVPLWPDRIPGRIDDPAYQEFLDTDEPCRIRQVTDPTLTIYRPSKEKSQGTAIIICPGGGYHRLAYDHEGFQVAEWLQTIGITGIVLKYRLPDDRIMKDKSTGPLYDALMAVQTARINAESWDIDPDKIGIMGFSAGGHLAATASVLYNDFPDTLKSDVSVRPDFSILIYPVISFRDSITHPGSRTHLLGLYSTNEQKQRFSADEHVTEDTPPAILIQSLDDDSVSPQNSLNYFNAMRRNGIACELHLFESGGHGYGFTRGKGTEKEWPGIVSSWLEMHGWL